MGQRLRPRVLASLCVPSLCALFACDARVRCVDDADCPDSVPFCADDFCGADAPVDDPACTVDADCAGDLCYDALDDSLDDSALQQTCVGAVRDNCESARLETVRSRDGGGPALFDVSLGDGAGGCPAESFNIRFRWLDREGDMVDPTAFTAALFVRVDGDEFASGSALVTATVVGENPLAAAIADYEICGPPPVSDVALWLEDQAGHRSNVVCVLP